jgi:cytochrome c peroxidase
MSKKEESTPDATSVSETKPKDLSEIRQYILSLFHDWSHDDGSLAPLMLRYAWHLCGTYDATSNTGGSNGCTMRFDTERNDPENAGFIKAHQFVATVMTKFPNLLSQADVQILAGTLAIESMGGPRITFRYGRVDFTEEEARSRYGKSMCPFGDGANNPCGSRLPAADLGPNPKCPHATDPELKEQPTIQAVRNTFARMGFDDKETVVLIVLGHQFGRCHPDVSGYEHPWYVFDPTHWNIYEHGLGYLSAYFMGRYREEVSSGGKRQFNMNLGGGEPFMMLVSDMALLWDEDYKKHLSYYNRHRKAFKIDCQKAWIKLTELGVPEEQLQNEL